MVDDYHVLFHMVVVVQQHSLYPDKMVMNLLHNIVDVTETLLNFFLLKKIYGKYQNKYQTQTPTVNRLWMKLRRWIYRIETKIHPTITDAIQIMTYRNQYLRMSVCAFELIEERHWIFLILWQMMMTMTNVGLCKFFFCFSIYIKIKSESQTCMMMIIAVITNSQNSATEKLKIRF